ncbi:hypothetical protein SAMN02799630_03704 [Paenibacillus sp. UNCCL117]|nr:hypothetical protein SAMN04488602_10993 [Paenibacillus sp. cl123]SFW49740.1 hypothetical protein SAMN02799630_03704 [Paenibacillus sp. UNCCL117]
MKGKKPGVVAGGGQEEFIEVGLLSAAVPLWLKLGEFYVRNDPERAQALPALSRYSVGVMPVYFLNVRRKLLVFV